MKLQRRKSDKKLFKAQRERTRMLAINKALIYLKCVLENSLLGSSNSFQNLPKIETLKLAKNYINILQNQVNQGLDYSTDEFIEMLTFNLKNSTAKLLKRVIVGCSP